MLSLDVGIYNPIAKALESYYQDAIKTAWRHIDEEEMEMIVKQIQKAREK